MKCPHCREKFHRQLATHDLPLSKGVMWRIAFQVCPGCDGLIIILQRRLVTGDVADEFIIHPRTIDREPPPPEVEEEYARDYIEACAVIPLSPKASAALSRRLLQHILREKAGVTPADLSKEIQQAIDENLVPGHLATAIDAVRNIGNFAAHPIKSTHTGEVVDVEPGEAEWLLEVLEGCFDFFFVQPARLTAKQEALNEKLASIGKPPMKVPPKASAT